MMYAFVHDYDHTFLTCMYVLYVCMYGSESACVEFELRGCDEGRASAAAGDEGPRGQLRRQGAMQ